MTDLIHVPNSLAWYLHYQITLPRTYLGDSQAQKYRCHRNTVTLATVPIAIGYKILGRGLVPHANSHQHQSCRPAHFLSTTRALISTIRSPFTAMQCGQQISSASAPHLRAQTEQTKLA